MAGNKSLHATPGHRERAKALQEAFSRQDCLLQLRRSHDQ